VQVTECCEVDEVSLVWTIVNVEDAHGATARDSVEVWVRP